MVFMTGTKADHYSIYKKKIKKKVHLSFKYKISVELENISEANKNTKTNDDSSDFSSLQTLNKETVCIKK